MNSKTLVCLIFFFHINFSQIELKNFIANFNYEELNRFVSNQKFVLVGFNRSKTQYNKFFKMLKGLASKFNS